MNSDEIKKEAQKRLDSMTPEEKRAALGLTDEEQELLGNAKNYWKMSKQEKSKFQSALIKKSDNMSVGSGLQGSFETDLEDEFGITREDIKNMAKNPYKARMLKDMLMVLILNVGSAALAVTGLAAAIPALEIPAGLFAISFAKNIMNYFKYKKVQKKYISGELTQEEIRAEVYNRLVEEQQKEKEEEKGRKL